MNQILCFHFIQWFIFTYWFRMIQEVKQLVHELRRITLLWDELWLGTLNQQHIDVTRKLQQLEAEVKKVMNNSSLTKDEKLAIIKEKHRTIMKPVIIWNFFNFKTISRLLKCFIINFSIVHSTSTHVCFSDIIHIGEITGNYITGSGDSTWTVVSGEFWKTHHHGNGQTEKSH